MMEKFIVSTKEEGLILEKYVKKVLKDAPLSFIYKLFRKKDVKVNGHWQDRKYVLKSGDEITVYVNKEQLEDFSNQAVIKSNDAISKNIIYEDANILLINKPRGLLVQPDASNEMSLDKMVLEYLSFKNEYNSNDTVFTPGPVHRLDRNTSGIIAFGKNTRVLQYLSEAFKNHDVVGKHYYALVVGNVEEDGMVDKPLYKGTNNKVYVSDKKEAKPAQTIYHVLERYENYTLLDIILLTGRTHQIRVHMASINHPVVGDEKYGDFAVNELFLEKYKFKNQFLHAYELSFYDMEDPLKYLKNTNFIADLPNEMISILKDLKGE